VKLYRPVRLSDRARDALDGSRGVRELENLREARSRGVPVVRPLAAGRCAGEYGTRSFLVTETVPGAPLPKTGWTAAEAAAAGALLRRAHDAGLHARDLHPGNLLLGAAGAWLCDLTDVVLANALEDEQRARALAAFCLALDGLADDKAARPLLAAYGASDALRADATRRGRRLRNRALTAFGRRATRACRHTVVESDDRAHTFWHAPAGEDLRAAVRRFVTGGPSAAPVKSGRRGAVWLEQTLAVKERPAAAARKLFRAAYWLAAAGTPTATPVALRLARGRGLVFFRRFANPDLRTELRAGALDDEARRAAAHRLGLAIGRMHAFGLRARDLKLDNLVREPGGGVALVDLDGLRRHRPFDARGQGRDLGRLLAGYRDAAGDVDPRVVSAFVRGYHRSRLCLRLTTPRHLFVHSAARAAEWLRTHPQEAPQTAVRR
jgi:tRNA A-37 threonylcarbamoyl transferase component Bud32